MPDIAALKTLVHAAFKKRDPCQSRDYGCGDRLNKAQFRHAVIVNDGNDDTLNRTGQQKSTQQRRGFFKQHRADKQESQQQGNNQGNG